MNSRLAVDIQRLKGHDLSDALKESKVTKA
jgi:hypothetical protein